MRKKDFQTIISDIKKQLSESYESIKDSQLLGIHGEGILEKYVHADTILKVLADMTFDDSVKEMPMDYPPLLDQIKMVLADALGIIQTLYSIDWSKDDSLTEALRSGIRALEGLQEVEDELESLDYLIQQIPD